MPKTAPQTSWAKPLTRWYRQHRRKMPWRENASPYRVWISEIMLQQTRVDTVIPYFERFTAKFPTVESLAAANEHDILSLWQGLGYYSRGRNLLKAAKSVMAEHDGKLPGTATELRTLPGVGPYTAAAIASISFGEPEPVVDGNVLRVVSRLDAMHLDIAKPATKTHVTERLRAEIEPADPSDFNQGIMELGATVCTPHNPKCTECPISVHCVGMRTKTTHLFPVKSKKGKPPHYPVAALLLESQGAILLQQRPEGGMLAGLWDLPQIRLGTDEQPSSDIALAQLPQTSHQPVVNCDNPIVIQHAYTHFKITIHTWRATIPEQVLLPQGYRWVTVADELPDWPTPKSTRKILESNVL